MTTSAPRPTPLWAMLAGSLVLVSLASALGGALTAESVESWYPTLIKPEGTPPNAAFPVVWSLLYAMMGIAAFLVFKKAGSFEAGRMAFIAYGVQLALNVLWSAIFFGLHLPLAAGFEIIVLLAAILVTIILFARWSKLAALLLAPYALWVSYASWLNWGIVALN